MQKTWFITGATSGLGLEMTQQLLADGQKVIATARRPEALEQLRRDHSAQLDILPLDLTEPDSIAPAIEGAFARHQRVDVIVSNAGYGLFGAAEELTRAQIDRQIATNLAGSIHLIRAALPFLRRQGGGRIMGNLLDSSSFPRAAVPPRRMCNHFHPTVPNPTRLLIQLGFPSQDQRVDAG